jgi:hypothetical protein
MYLQTSEAKVQGAAEKNRTKQPVYVRALFRQDFFRRTTSWLFLIAFF